MATFTLEQTLQMDGLNYTQEKRANIDWNMLSYTDWRTPEFWAAKYPEGLIEMFPGLWQHCENLAEQYKDKTPLMELEERQKACETESEKPLESEKPSV